GGSGTVTTMSTGNLAPLFTASVVTATTTPALSFALSNAAAHTFFGNNTGSTAAPAYLRLACADLSDSASGCSTAATSFPLSATVLGTNGSGQPVAATTTGSGTTVPLATSPVLDTPSVTTINDATAHPFIASSATASAVDSLTIT